MKRPRSPAVWLFVVSLFPIATNAGVPPNILDDNRGDEAKAASIYYPYLTLLGLLDAYPQQAANLVIPPTSLSGHVLKNLKIHNVFWDDDWNGHNRSLPTTEQIDAFTQALVDSPYFNSAGQYGVESAEFTGSSGAYATCLPPVPYLAPVEFGEIMVWAACMASFPQPLAVTTPSPPFFPTTGLPSPDDDTLYVIYLPRGASIADVDCHKAYHFMDTAAKFSFDPFPYVTPQKTFAFAVVQTSCVTGGSIADRLDRITEIASHEIIEGATDPLWGLGWINNGIMDHLDLSTFFPQLITEFADGEAADICEQGLSDPPGVPPAFLHPTAPIVLPATDASLGGGISVAPYWSNTENACAPIFPISMLSIGAPMVPAPAMPPFVTDATPFTLTATYNGASDGIASVSHRFYDVGSASPPDFDNEPAASSVFTISGPDGQYVVDTFSTARNGTIESPANTQTVSLDDTPPTSALTIGAPRYPSVATQPFVTSDTTFTVNANDDGSGVGSIADRFFPEGGTSPAYTATSSSRTEFRVTGPDGPYEVDTFAADKLDNEELAHSQLVHLDNSAPTIEINVPAAGDYPHSAVMTLDYSVDDGSGSGVESTTVSLDGFDALGDHGLESGRTINLLVELTPGPHVFAIHAVDHLNNESQTSVTFTIVVTPMSLAEAIHEFLAAGCIDNAGVANSLIRKLSAAERAISAGNVRVPMNTLNAFLNEVRGQREHIAASCSVGGIPVDPANVLATDAAYLIGTL